MTLKELGQKLAHEILNGLPQEEAGDWLMRNSAGLEMPPEITERIIEHIKEAHKKAIEDHQRKQ